MGLTRIIAKAPSNIALVKYMGKSDPSRNLPDNPSLSLTLSALCTWIEAECVPDEASLSQNFRWIPERPRVASENATIPQLSENGIAKFLRHAERVEKACPEIFSKWGIQSSRASVTFRTANTFPAGAGIASSASAFAALTLATAASQAADLDRFQRAFSEREFKRALADLSRQGSGSSCRSFEGPFVEWEGENARAVDGVRFSELSHFVVLISREEKKVSSSDAHLEVKTSPLWKGRVERASERFKTIRAALQSGNYVKVATTTWQESWEMHSLFHTCEKPFTYWQPGSIDALHWLAPFVNSTQPPIVTMDAGPNVHVMVPRADGETWYARLAEKFGSSSILRDQGGNGAELVRWEKF